MFEVFVRRLVSVKSIVTIMLTVTFMIMSLNGTISQEFMTVYTVVIAFYFSSQANKPQTPNDGVA